VGDADIHRADQSTNPTPASLLARLRHHEACILSIPRINSSFSQYEIQNIIDHPSKTQESWEVGEAGCRLQGSLHFEGVL